MFVAFLSVYYIFKNKTIFEQKWSFGKVKNCPQQPNGNDCGVYVCFFIECLIKKIKIFEIFTKKGWKCSSIWKKPHRYNILIILKSKNLDLYFDFNNPMYKHCLYIVYYILDLTTFWEYSYSKWYVNSWTLQHW
jgi:hypothetical protein